MKIRNLFVFTQLVATLSGAETSVPAAANALGLDLFRLESGHAESRNILLSPYSIQTALSMTLEGAEGKTQEEMRRVLHLNSEPEKVAGEFESLRQSLEKVVEESRKRLESMKREGGHFEPLQLRPANRLFGQSSYPFREAFLRCTQDVWLAPLEKIAFDKDPESARKHINDWVEQQTAKRIVNLLPARSVNAGTR
jgi:serpin B